MYVINIIWEFCKIIPKEKIIEIITKYFTEGDIDELYYILFDFYLSTFHDYLNKIFKYYFNYIDFSNKKNWTNFYSNKKYQIKNMEILLNLFKTLKHIH